jgi:selenocysteine lyase/cysteine desulfurase
MSNICSFSLPIEKIGALCKKNHILFAVDCAQSMGHIPIDMQKMNVDFLSSPGHKGLYGLQGSAFVAINQNILLDTLVEGGNGVNSLESSMGNLIPERYEAGTLSLPSIVSLYEGLQTVKKLGIDYIHEHECELFKYTVNELMNISRLHVYAPNFTGSTLLFNIDSISAEQISRSLDDKNICSRAGFHCAPLAHASLGTQSIGALRISFGIYNNKSDIIKLLSAISKGIQK